MKELKQLKPFLYDLNTLQEHQKRIYRRSKAFEKWILSNFPGNVKGQYSFGDIGESCIRVFIYLDKDEENTINLLKWFPSLKGKMWKIEKFWREDDGYFAYRIEREYKWSTRYIIFIEKAANIDGCKIKKKRKIQTIYVTDCELERQIL